MKASTRARLERLERKIAPPSAPPSHGFSIIDLGTWTAEARAAYRAASDAEDWATCNRLMEEHAGIPCPTATTRRRRWSNRPPRVVELVIDHIEGEPIDLDDEPDDRRRSDGVPVVVGPQNAPALDPDEIIGFDKFGFPETRVQRAERLKRQTGGIWH